MHSAYVHLGIDVLRAGREARARAAEGKGHVSHKPARSAGGSSRAQGSCWKKSINAIIIKPASVPA